MRTISLLVAGLILTTACVARAQDLAKPMVLVASPNLEGPYSHRGGIRGDISEALRPTRWIETVDKSKVKYLKATEPAVLTRLADALTTTPNKPSVAIEANVASTAERRDV